MGATIQKNNRGIWVLRVTGALRKEELDDVQDAWIRELGPQVTGKVLVVVGDDFTGWEGGEVWGDMSFFMEHGDKVEKFAIVGDATWESRMLMFTGAGLRRTPVKYFTKDRLAEAYEWLG